jgi:membrane associated rhomboid family serine protease
MVHAVYMSDTPQTSRDRSVRGAEAVLVLLGAMWAVQLVNSLDSYRLDSNGIVPRDWSGLRGVVFSPFLHASWGHLIGNSIPFVVLGLMIGIAGPGRLLVVTAIVAVVAGLGTWLTSPSNSDTVGASGVVFGYAAYLIARGFFNRRMTEIGLGVIVAVLFGGALLTSLVPHSGVSWEDHAFGALGGLLAAMALRDNRPRVGTASGSGGVAA